MFKFSNCSFIDLLVCIGDVSLFGNYLVELIFVKDNLHIVFDI